MRLRNVKNKEEIMNASSYLVKDYFSYKGKWKELFGNENPIYIEIGMGKGKFIIENAIAHPEINYIGIEKYDSVIAKGLQKIPDGLKNLVMVRADALSIDEIFDHEIDHIYLNFSDPWPKKRWHKRRLTSDVFLKKYDSLFKKDCLIIQKTDNQDLFEYSVVSLSTYGYKIVDFSLDLHNSEVEGNIMTEYEERFSKQGNPIFYMVALKEDKNN